MIKIHRNQYNNLQVVTRSVQDQFRAIQLFKDMFLEQFNVTSNEYNKGKITCNITIPEDHAAIFSFEMMRVMNEHNLHDQIDFTDLKIA